MESSSTTFAQLIPSNTLAKLAFSAMCDVHNNTPRRGKFYVHPEQQYDKNVLLYRLQEEKKVQGNIDSDTPTEPDTDTENAEKYRGMIWTGWFCFNLRPGPYEPTKGWTIGKGGRTGVAVDYLLTLHQIPITLRACHARFNFHERTGYLFISKTSNAPNAEVTVSGTKVNSGQQFSLNQNSMNVRIGSLEFEFKYTEFANTNQFYVERQGYLKDKLNATRFPDSSITPTPTHTSRCFGQWTILNPLGRGAYGKVSSATNSGGDIVAIKIVDRNERTVHQVNREIHILNELQKLCEVNEGDRNRVIQLREAIYQNGEVYAATVFEEVALVLEPAVPATLTNITSPFAVNRLKYDMPDTISLFHDALLGLNFLHSHNWVHGDLKPSNIGILNASFPHAILLDFGEAVNLEPGKLLPATPGRGGTLNYLAPEREIQGYDHSADVWSLGVIGFEVLHGYHPWKIASNPWRVGSQFEALRPLFHDAYDKALHKMRSCANTKLNELLLQMVRYPWAEDNNGARIITRDALKHVCWKDIEEEGQPLIKRSRP